MQTLPTVDYYSLNNRSLAAETLQQIHRMGAAFRRFGQGCSLVRRRVSPFGGVMESVAPPASHPWLGPRATLRIRKRQVASCTRARERSGRRSAPRSPGGPET